MFFATDSTLLTSAQPPPPTHNDNDVHRTPPRHAMIARHHYGVAGRPIVLWKAIGTANRSHRSRGKVSPAVAMNHVRRLMATRGDERRHRQRTSMRTTAWWRGRQWTTAPLDSWMSTWARRRRALCSMLSSRFFLDHHRHHHCSDL